MPYISISHAASYDEETSASILGAVTEAYAETAGVPRDKVWATLQEVPRSNWSTGGSTLAQKDRERGER